MAKGIIPSTASMKGVFISMSVFMLTSVLVLLALSISGGNAESMNSAWPVIGIQHAGEGIDMASDGVRGIALANNIGAQVSGLSASYWTPYPVPTNYSLDLFAWGLFLSGYASPDPVQLDSTNSSRPQIWLRPQNISLDWANSSFWAIPANAGYSSGNISAYHLNITLNDTSAPTLVWNNQTNLPQANPQALRLDIMAWGGATNATSDTYVNRSAYNEIALMQGGFARAWVRIWPEASLELAQNQSAMGLNITVEMAPGSPAPRVEMPEKMAGVSAGSNILYNATVRLD